MEEKSYQVFRGAQRFHEAQDLKFPLGWWTTICIYMDDMCFARIHMMGVIRPEVLIAILKTTNLQGERGLFCPFALSASHSFLLFPVEHCPPAKPIDFNRPRLPAANPDTYRFGRWR